MSAQCVELGKYEEALELLGMMGVRKRLLTPRFRSMLNGRRANVLAHLGDAEEADRCLAVAEEFADADQDERDLM